MNGFVLRVYLTKEKIFFMTRVKRSINHLILCFTLFDGQRYKIPNALSAFFIMEKKLSIEVFVYEWNLNKHASLCTLTYTMVNANINEDIVIFFEIHTYQDHTQCVTAKTQKVEKKIEMIFARCENKELIILEL